MWKDLVDRTEVLKRNEVVRHLIDTPKHTYEKGEPFVSPQDRPGRRAGARPSCRSRRIPPRLAAVVAAARGKDFVLFGPPGTGKSQTITTSSPTCLAHGKTVLFVSQKTAALEVVQRRLDEIGLGSYCLEVHSSKAQKSKVVEQLDAWKNASRRRSRIGFRRTSDLKRRRDELNAVVSALHRRRENGMSAFEAFSRVVADRDVSRIGLDLAAVTSRHGIDDLQRLREACRVHQDGSAGGRLSAGHRLSGVNQTRWTPAWREDFSVGDQTYRTALGSCPSGGQMRSAPRSVCRRSSGTRRRSSSLANYLVERAARRGAPFRGDADRRQPGALLQRWQASSAGRESSLASASSTAPMTCGCSRRTFVDAASWSGRRRGARTSWSATAGKEKVRLKLKPFCESVPEDMPQISSSCRTSPTWLQRPKITAGAWRVLFWRGLDTDVTKFGALREWQEKTLGHIANLGAAYPDRKRRRRAHAFELLTSYGHIFAENGARRRSGRGSRGEACRPEVRGRQGWRVWPG